MSSSQQNPKKNYDTYDFKEVLQRSQEYEFSGSVMKSWKLNLLSQTFKASSFLLNNFIDKWFM